MRHRITRSFDPMIRKLAGLSSRQSKKKVWQADSSSVNEIDSDGPAKQQTPFRRFANGAFLLPLVHRQAHQHAELFIRRILYDQSSRGCLQGIAVDCFQRVAAFCQGGLHLLFGK